MTLLRCSSAAALGNQLIVLGHPVALEVEEGLLVVLAQVEVAACDRELVTFGAALRDDLTRGRDDGALR